MSTLTFDQLREANERRLPLFKNSKGEPAHPSDDGSDWSIGEWVCAVTGELGELANLIKKIRRGDIDRKDPKVLAEVADELADVACYLDILAFQFRIDLGAAVVDKFNRVSDRIKVNVKIEPWWQVIGVSNLIDVNDTLMAITKHFDEAEAHATYLNKTYGAEGRSKYFYKPAPATYKLYKAR